MPVVKGQATSGGTADNWASFAGARMSRVVLYSDLIADATRLFRALDLFDPDKAGEDASSCTHAGT